MYIIDREGKAEFKTCKELANPTSLHRLEMVVRFGTDPKTKHTHYDELHEKDPW